MEFKEIQDGVVANAMAYGEKYNVDIDPDFALLKLFEEAGELAQAALIHHKKSRPEKHLPEEESKQGLGEEIADVVGMAMVCAKLYDIDLEEIITKKWINRD